MHKDVIYIDVEDDITAIISKIKASKEKIVALVPPKRTGTLQSAVNLRLLARMADNNNKRLVIITNNKALVALAASAKIHVAKNLQSKPEIAEIAALEIDDGDDVIEGSNLPIGELEKTADIEKEGEVEEVIGTIDVEKKDAESSHSAKKDRIKVPDFSRFRKKLFLGIILGISFIVFIVWATQTAPAATIIITAKTGPAPVSATLKIGGTTATDVSKNIVQTVTKQIKKDVSVDFTATGTKKVGVNKATGTITVKNCDTTTSFSIDPGTIFTADSGKTFVNTTAATVPGYTGSASLCRNFGMGAGTVDVSVTAVNAGTDYNIDATDYTITDISGDIYANGSDMAGGTDKTATVVSATDIQTASQALADLSFDSYKQQLISQFTNSESVIKDSFSVVHAAVVSVPAVGEEVTSGKAKLTSNTTFSITSIAKSELQAYLKYAINKQLGKDERMYNDGYDGMLLSGYDGQALTVNITAKDGRIGPDINKDSIKKQAMGKRYGEVQSLIEAIRGVDSVDIKFSYFWVTTVPNDVNKISVEFTISK